MDSVQTQARPDPQALERKALLLVLIPISREYLAPLENDYAVVYLDQVQDRERFLSEHGASAVAVLTNGMIGVRPALRIRLPALRIVACNGVGYDAIDLQWARENRIAVCNTPDVLSGDVADLALALMLAVCRNIPAADAFVRGGRWPEEKLPLGRRAWGSKVGIVGLGRIGSLIARRCEAFDMQVAYHTRSPRPDAPYRHVASLVELAAWCDVLVVATPGGQGTKALVSAAILEALGPAGILINIARGSVVDEEALVHALSTGTIAGAGLDVFAHEPHVPEVLRQLPNVVLTPHIASATAQTRAAMVQLVVENLLAFRQGRPLPSPVPMD